MFSLPEGQLAAPGGDTNLIHCFLVDTRLPLSIGTAHFPLQSLDDLPAEQPATALTVHVLKKSCARRVYVVPFP
jgi:hypothetical protein